MWVTARENREGDLSTSCWRSWRRNSIHSLSLCLSVSISVSQSLTHSPSDCLSPSNMNVFSVSYKVTMPVWESIKHHYQSLKHWNCVCLSPNVVWINPLKSHCALVTFLAALRKNKWVCTVYIYYVYINTHTCIYIFKKNMSHLYIKYIYIWYNLYEYKYIYVNTCKYFQNMCCMCVSLYMHNKYTQHTHIYYVNKNLYFGCD